MSGNKIWTSNFDKYWILIDSFAKSMLEIFSSQLALQAELPWTLPREIKFPMLRPAVWLTMWSLVQKLTKLTCYSILSITITNTWLESCEQLSFILVNFTNSAVIVHHQNFTSYVAATLLVALLERKVCCCEVLYIKSIFSVLILFFSIQRCVCIPK